MGQPELETEAQNRLSEPTYKKEERVFWSSVACFREGGVAIKDLWLVLKVEMVISHIYWVK